MTAIATINPRGTQLAETNDRAILNALRDSFYPGAKEDSILMVLNYCKAAGLDPMTRPVHIVPMNVKKPGTRDYEWRDVVMPGIEFYRTKADRTGRYAGQDDAEFGPEIHNDAWNVTYPQWCKVTVYKLTDVGRVAYSAKVFWTEAYSTQGKDSSAPNAMWRKRPFGQIEKCAEAAALRKAFPEVGGQPTADEMSGKTLDSLSHEVTDVIPISSITGSRTEAVKAKLSQRTNRQGSLDSSPPEPGPDLVTVLRMIEEAYTKDELNASVEAAKLLPKVDQVTARDAYKARVAEIKAQQEAEAAAMAEPGPAGQTVAEWQKDFMGGEA